MNLTRLQVFAQVAQSGSMAAAAELLHLTPSAVSQQMTRLEAEVGATLLIRHPTGVELTLPGQALVARAEEILGAVRDAQAELDTITATGAERVRFGSAVAALAARVAPVFRARHPGVRLHLTLDKSHRIAPLLRDRALDLAIVFEADRPVGVDHLRQTHTPRQALALEPLFEEELEVLLPADHRLAAGPVDPVELAAEPLVGSEAAHGMGDLAAALRERGAEPRFLDHWSFDYGAVAQLVRCGEGLAVVPPLSLEPLPDDLVLRPLTEAAPRRRIMLAEPAGARRTPAARALRGVVVDLLGHGGQGGGPRSGGRRETLTRP